MVFRNKGSGKRLSKIPKKNREPPAPSPRTQTRPAKQDPLGGLPLLSRKMKDKGLSQTAMEFMQYAWRKSTKKVYSTYLKKWTTFCIIRDYDMYHPEQGQVIDFLIRLAKKGAAYKTVNIARCALSAVLPTVNNMTIGCEEMVGWTVRGVNNFNPPKPRYTSFWDVNLVLNLFRRWGNNRDLTLFRISAKVTVLLLLLTAQRGQTIWRLNVSGLEFFPDRMVFKLKHLLKHNKPGDPLDTLQVPAYPSDELLCPVKTVKHYLRRTRDHRRGQDQMLLISRAPFSPASRDTVARWSKSVLKWAGIDTTRFAGHSTRGAATSKACKLGIDINLLLRQASWKNADTFGRFYNKTIERADQTLAHLLLNDRREEGEEV